MHIRTWKITTFGCTSLQKCAIVAERLWITCLFACINDICFLVQIRNLIDFQVSLQITNTQMFRYSELNWFFSFGAFIALLLDTQPKMPTIVANNIIKWNTRKWFTKNSRSEHCAITFCHVNIIMHHENEMAREWKRCTRSIEMRHIV